MFGRKVKDDLVDLQPAEGQGKKLNPKVLIAGIAVVLVVGVAFLVTTLLGGSKKNNLSVLGALNDVICNETGSFIYRISVNTGEAGTVITQAEKVASMEELQTMAGAVDDTSGGEAQSKYEFQDWDKYAEVRAGDWEHPVYQILIEGSTTSVDPLTTHFVVSVATPYKNDKFTDVTCFNGNYYIDIETMRSWLTSSADDYLVNVGERLPQGSRYLVIPEAEFKVGSRYAESSEYELSQVVGLTNLYRRFLMGYSAVSGSLLNNVSSDAFNNDKTAATMRIVGNDSVTVINNFKYMVNNITDLGDKIVQSGVGNNLYNDSQVTQHNRERDNILEAFSGLRNAVNTCDPTALNLQMTGIGRSYDNISGGQTKEATVTAMFTNNGVDYSIAFAGERRTNADEVTLPQGSQLAFSSLQYVNEYGEVAADTDTYKISIVQYVLDCIGDYFNFTGIDTGKKLDIMPDRIANHAVDEFIELVNQAGTYDKHLTRNNFHEFAEKYTNFDETAAGVVDTDYANAQLMQDFLTELNNLTGGLVVEKIVEKEEEIPQYPEVTFSQQGIDFTLKYNEELSSDKLIVLDGEAINKGSASFTIDLTEFSLQTLLGSIYPANNETMLLAYDSTFDMESVKLSVDSLAGSWNEFKLYFVPLQDTGHMDLFFGSTQRGAAVEY